MKIFLFILLFITNHSSAQTTIYLTRHAEKITSKDNKDPELTKIGEFRAINIAKQLSKVGISHIFSTDYNRTLQTAQPLADFLKIEIEKYDASKLPEFAEKIKSMHGAILIVGHSNTTPNLTALLSGKEVAPIHENEFDNLYQVIISKDDLLLNRFKSIPSYGLDSSAISPPKQKLLNED